MHHAGLKKNGFTLLEILVALAIFSVIIGALYSAFFLSQKAVDAVDDSLVRLQEARAVVDVMKREIESSYYTDQTSNSKKYTIFKLDDRDFYGKQASQLLFTAFTPLIPGLARITYTVEENDGRLTLKKKIISAFAQTDKTKDIEVIEDLESFTVEVKYNGKWVKTWDSTMAKAPVTDEIRISLKMQPKKRNKEEQSPQGLLTISDIVRRKIGNTI